MNDYETMINKGRALILQYDEMIELCGHSICNRALKLQWILFKHQALEILGEEDTRDYWKEDKPYWENEKNKLKIN